MFREADLINVKMGKNKILSQKFPKSEVFTTTILHSLHLTALTTTTIIIKARGISKYFKRLKM